MEILIGFALFLLTVAISHFVYIFLQVARDRMKIEIITTPPKDEKKDN